MLRRSLTAVLGLAGLAACSDRAPTPLAPRVAPGVAHAVSPTDADPVAGNYLVTFRTNAIPAGFADRVSALGGEVIFAHAGVGIAAVAGLDSASAAALGTSSGVAAVDADAYSLLEQPASMEVLSADASTPDSPTNPTAAAFYGRQWNMRAIHADAAWAAGKTGSPTTRVGVMDTGIDYLAPDLYGRVDLAASRSFLSAAENARVQAAFPGANPIADLNYHGTHVAATIASNGLLAAGVTSRVTLVGLKVCVPGTAPSFSATCPTSAILNAILYAADNGIPVANMSLGGSFLRRQASARGGFSPSFLAVINSVFNYAYRQGTTIVVAAGNSAIDLDHDGNGYAAYCNAPHAVCVSATGPTSASLVGTAQYPLGIYTNVQNVDALAGYSNYGRSAITVAGPGGNAIPVWAACSGFTIVTQLLVCRNRYYNPATGGYTGYVVGLAGTSMATPHTTGVAALILSGGTTGAAQLRAVLTQSADDLGQPGVDPAYGNGRINAARAAGVN